MEPASSRTIRIGTANIGLLDLDTALNKAASKNLTPEEAADFLFNIISQKNYIPSGLEKQYRDGLLSEYKKHMQIEINAPGNLVVRIFGSSCISCNKLQSLLINILDEMELAADIEQIHDPDEIGRYGIVHTPALIINGTIKCHGYMPARAQVEAWIRETLD